MNAQSFQRPLPVLRRGQRQVVERAILGETGDEIAAYFGMSRSAVEASLLNARQRVGARNTTHLCAIAVARGLVDAAPLFEHALERAAR